MLPLETASTMSVYRGIRLVKSTYRQLFSFCLVASVMFELDMEVQAAFRPVVLSTAGVGTLNFNKENKILTI
jgi:hypothetical protein